jgi:nicotinamide mononucleotide transporter
VLSWVEVLGFATGAASVWLAVRENVWNWPIAAANAVFFFILFYGARLYADMGLQVFFFGLAILGWYRWLRGGPRHSRLTVSNVTRGTVLWLAPLGVAATVALTVYLRRIHDAAPFLDAITTVLSLAGQYLMTKKVIENWYVWIAADVLYIYLYIQRELYLTSVLYVIFLLMCIAGVVQWQRSLTSRPRLSPAA